QVLPAPNENEPAKAKYTLEEQAFLGELEAYVQLARIVQEDTRYLFVIDEMIKAYMKKNNAIAFPVHMSRATELLSTLESWQSNIMDRIDLDAADFVKPKPLSENCFYHQVQEAVKSAQWTRTLKERVLFTRVVQLIVETYLSSNNHTLLPANVSDKFGEITDKLCGIFERELLSKNLPYLTGD
ncbi:MAG: hypothetical protein LLF94_04470, partial [Chlamydiales bacterium]|nr:hypothetical protein [Chlamydiales bacterium]